MDIMITIFLPLIIFNVIFYGFKCIKWLAEIKEDITYLHRQLSVLQDDMCIVSEDVKETNMHVNDIVEMINSNDEKIEL